MLHLNGNLLGVLDVETTGFTPGYHDIIEVCVLILDEHLDPTGNPFVLELQPQRPENINLEALRIQGKHYDPVVKTKSTKSRHRVVDVALNGCDADYAADLFGDWFQSLKLGPFKKIMPIACNYAFDRSFLIEWLGPEAFNTYFSPQYRDVMSMALFENDIADHRGYDIKYPKCNLSALCNALNIERDRAHTAVDDVHDTAKVFKRLIRNSIR
jgi:DNA polymerase III epsilon subunit-like protein